MPLTCARGELDLRPGVITSKLLRWSPGGMGFVICHNPYCFNSYTLCLQLGASSCLGVLIGPVQRLGVWMDQKYRRCRVADISERPAFLVYFHKNSPIMVCVMAWIILGSVPGFASKAVGCCRSIRSNVEPLIQL